jgi:hypothetical protein
MGEIKPGMNIVVECCSGPSAVIMGQINKMFN